MLGTGFLILAAIPMLPTVANALALKLGLYATPETMTCKIQEITPLPPPPPDYQYSDGTRYYGSLNAQGQPTADGKGIIVFTSGHRYDGELRDNQRNGCGTFTFENGQRYDGEFRNDTYHGQGIWQFANGDRYIGNMKNGKCQGLGTYVDTNGNIRRGFWWNGTLIGTQISCDR